MGKYTQVVRVTLQEYFVYRLNFLLWRFRSVVQILVLYFLWQAAIPEGATVFGYDQSKILTYILGTSIIRSLALSSRSIDVAGQISNGDFSNFLIKPISYLKYWFAKDVADKLLNIIFSFLEISLILIILKPPLLLQTNPLIIFCCLLAVLIAMLLYFFLSFLLSIIAFWTPEAPWPLRFLFTIILEFLSGGFFPLDILPRTLFSLLMFLPFSYILFFPLNVYLGQMSTMEIFTGLLTGMVWILIVYLLVQYFLKLGIKKYEAWGR